MVIASSIENSLLLLTVFLGTMSIGLCTMFQFRALKNELQLLPLHSVMEEKDTIETIGKNIFDYLPRLTLSKTDLYYIVVVSSCTCPFCDSGIEELILHNKKRFQIINLVECADYEKMKDSLFQDEISATHWVSKHAVQGLGITQFPTYMLINKDGEILNENTWSKPLFNEINQ